MKNEFGIRFADIGGYELAKEEAGKLADILAHFDIYKAKGVAVPKGLLISGAPGVGKTMLAKAMAAEAGVPFFELEIANSGQEGASHAIERVFAEAKEAAPSILFIDEIDALLPYDNYFSSYASDGSRGVLKTLLTEIDGISGSDGVLIVATTNQKECIPYALTRSGRLERQMDLDFPATDDRKAILEIYLSKVGIVGMDTQLLASKTGGLTGADLKVLVNEALINSVRANRDVALSDLLDVIPVIRFGTTKSEDSPKRKPYVVWHEIGHLLCQYALTGKLSSVSVEAYGDVQGHVVIEDELEDRGARWTGLDADGILDKVTVYLGGIAGEEVFLGKRYCGASADITSAIAAVKTVLANGVMGFQYLPELSMKRYTNIGGLVGSAREYEGSFQRKLVEILEERLQIARDLLRERKALAETIYPALIAKGSLSREELEQLIGHPPMVPEEVPSLERP